MADPLTNRGPEAFQRLLQGDAEGVTESLVLLTRTELTDLADAGERLARVARRIVETWPGPASAGEPEATAKDLQSRTEEYECATHDACRFDSRCPNYAMNCQRFERESDHG